MGVQVGLVPGTAGPADWAGCPITGHHVEVDSPAAAEVVQVLRRGRVVVLSGAGLSTESGIPDYRGPSGAAHRAHTPMTHQQFINDPQSRARYWARSHLGWGGFSSARPNSGHRAVARLEQLGLVVGTITQNVDGLHSAAGSRDVVDLHGRLDRVRCLGCTRVTPRSALASRLAAANLGWQAQAVKHNPDGDVELPEEMARQFRVVDCLGCGGVLMPDVVYFGGSVPSERAASAQLLVDGAAAMLVLGTTLSTYSARKLVKRASQSGKAVVVINLGPTRADELPTHRVAAPLGRTLTWLVDQLEMIPAPG